MSDPTYDFLSSGGGGGPPPVGDPTLDYLSTGGAETTESGEKPGWLRQILMAPVGGAEMLYQRATGFSASIPAALAYGGAAVGRAVGMDVDPAAVQSKVQNYFTHQPISDSAKAGNALLSDITGTVTKPIAKKYGEATEAVSKASPFGGELMKAAPSAFTAAAALVPTAAGAMKMRSEPFRPTDPNWKPPEHPLSEAAQAEAQRLDDMKGRAGNLGFDLPEGGSPQRHAAAAATNQPLANAVTRDELGLPVDAPLTPQLLDKARAHYASPAYQAIREEPHIKLDPQYETDIKALQEIPGEFSDKLKPPEGKFMTGEEAVDFAKKFRHRANQYDKQALVSGSPEASDLADLNRGAAEAIEDAVQRHLDANGKGQLAKDWHDARVYTAKTYSVQSALDGAGNVKVMNLKGQLLKNKPLSGNLEMLANLGAQYPQAFRLTPESAPGPGLMRRGAAALLPPAATAIGATAGSVVGMPTIGAVVGGAMGERAANRLVPR